MTKNRRHQAIIEIIHEGKVSTQEELCDTLQKKGFTVTQATVSRDIKELKLMKAPDRDGYHYVLPGPPAQATGDRLRRIFEDGVLSVDSSDTLIVVRTLPGTANAVASAIDTDGMAGILGTVAGDDTIIVVIKTKEAVNGVLQRFNQFLK
ncbi:MAG: arginine repressor [Chitinophagales bacterium]